MEVKHLLDDFVSSVLGNFVNTLFVEKLYKSLSDLITRNEYYTLDSVSGKLLWDLVAQLLMKIRENPQRRIQCAFVPRHASGNPLVRIIVRIATIDEGVDDYEYDSNLRILAEAESQAQVIFNLGIINNDEFGSVFIRNIPLEGSDEDQQNLYRSVRGDEFNKFATAKRIGKHQITLW